MKHKFSSVKFLLFLVLLIITTTAQTSARKLSDKLQGEEADTLNINNKISSEKSVAEIDQTTEDSFSKLMGVEECEEDEECLERRVLAEVHLDYIYTQKHKP